MDRPRERRRDLSTIACLIVAALCVLAGLLIRHEHPLVVIQSDRAGQPLFPTRQLESGQSTSSRIVLRNGGVLPFSYSLVVGAPGGDPLPSKLRIRIARVADGRVLYEGPLPASSGPLGRLAPGEQVGLDLRLSLPAGAPKVLTDPGLAFVWHGHATLLAHPSFALFLGLLLLVAATLLWLWMREPRPARVPRGTGDAALDDAVLRA